MLLSFNVDSFNIFNSGVRRTNAPPTHYMAVNKLGRFILSLLPYFEHAQTHNYNILATLSQKYIENKQYSKFEVICISYLLAGGAMFV